MSGQVNRIDPPQTGPMLPAPVSQGSILAKGSVAVLTLSLNTWCPTQRRMCPYPVSFARKDQISVTRVLLWIEVTEGVGRLDLLLSSLPVGSGTVWRPIRIFKGRF